MEFIYNDGGRAEAGYKGHTGDCVCRAIAICTGKPYKEIYDALAKGNATQRMSRRSRVSTHGRRTASMGINTTRKWFKDYMKSLGFEWTPTMKIGQGCKVHLEAEELPKGKLVVALSKHFTAVIDGVINDTYNPQKSEDERTWVHGDGTVEVHGQRCVYGYYKLKQ